MEGITVLDMAQALGIASEAVKRRLQRKGIQPFKYIGSAGIYKEEALESIRESTRGRPKAVSKPKTPQKKPAKKTAKKKP